MLFTTQEWAEMAAQVFTIYSSVFLNMHLVNILL